MSARRETRAAAAAPQTGGALAFHAADAARWSGGRLVAGAPDRLLRGASIDTRTIAPGTLFFAIRGPNHDAHRFLDTACQAGAAGLVVERGRAGAGAIPDGVAVIEVDDTTRALADIARGHRLRFGGPVIGLTGSSGKTSTKEMCAAVLRAKAPCLATRGNLNNEYGVPLTLLERSADAAAAIVEMGMNHRGEIARLAAIALPTIGLVTNIGTAHVEFLGSREAIAEEKGDLYAALPPDGTALVNLDDERVAEQAGRAPCPRRSYGVAAEEAGIRARDVRFAEGRFTFELRAPEGAQRLTVRGLSRTAVINAVAAAAVGLAAGATLTQVAAGLADYEPIPGRMTPLPLADDLMVVDDTYNANPDSMRAAIEAVHGLASAAGRRAIAVLGDMGELGAAADDAHRAAGAQAGRLGFAAVVALGERAALVCEGARSAGLAAGRAVTARSHEEAAERAAGLAAREGGAWLLVKGSRAMQMERVVDALRGARATNGSRAREA